MRRLLVVALMALLVLLPLGMFRAFNAPADDQPLIISPGLDGVATVTPEYDVIVTPRCVVYANTTYTDVVRLECPVGFQDVVGVENLTLNSVQIFEFRVFVFYSGMRTVLLYYRDGVIVQNNTLTMSAGTVGIMGISVLPTVTQMGALDAITFRLVVSYEHALLDVYTQKAGIGMDVPGDAFAPGDMVLLTAHLSYAGENVADINVGFEVDDPYGVVIVIMNNMTDENGVASISFRLSMNPAFGTYNATATARYLEYMAMDSVTFKVGWIVNVVSATPCDMYGNPVDSFVRGGMGYFKVVVDNIALGPRSALITVNAFDKHNVPIGVASFQGLVAVGRSEFIIVAPIPSWAWLGSALVYANAFTDWLGVGGVPYCPQVSNTFEITL